MKKLFYLVVLGAFVASCGNKSNSDVQPVSTDSNFVRIYEFQPVSDIAYITDTIEDNIVITYPDSAGYEVNYSETINNGFEIYGEYDKDDITTLKFMAFASKKIPTLDEKEHLDNELSIAEKEGRMTLIEQGEVNDILYTRYYAICDINGVGEPYRSFVCLHFDPKISNYYFVSIQTSDFDNFKKDMNILYPFIRDLRFLKKG